MLDQIIIKGNQGEINKIAITTIIILRKIMIIIIIVVIIKMIIQGKIIIKINREEEIGE